MITVVDACSALEIITEGRFCGSISAALEMGEYAIAPKFQRVEVLNAIRNLVRSGAVNAEAAPLLLKKAEGIIAKYLDDDDLLVESLNEAIHYNHSVYDMIYLVLARRTGAALVTLDRRLFDIAAHAGVWVYFDPSNAPEQAKRPERSWGSTHRAKGE